VAALARKLTVAVWYLMMGRWTALEEIDKRLSVKLAKAVRAVGQAALDKLGTTRKHLREQAGALLKARKVTAPAASDSVTQAQAQVNPESGKRIYVLDPTIQFNPAPRTQNLAEEYGLA